MPRPGEFALTVTVPRSEGILLPIVVHYVGRWAGDGIEFRCDEPGSGLAGCQWIGPHPWQDIVKMFDRVEVPDPPTPPASL